MPALVLAVVSPAGYFVNKDKKTGKMKAECPR